MEVYIVIRTWGIVKRDQIVCIKSSRKAAEDVVVKMRYHDYSDDQYRIEKHKIEFDKDK